MAPRLQRSTATAGQKPAAPRPPPASGAGCVYRYLPPARPARQKNHRRPAIARYTREDPFVAERPPNAPATGRHHAMRGHTANTAAPPAQPIPLPQTTAPAPARPGSIRPDRSGQPALPSDFHAASPDQAMLHPAMKNRWQCSPPASWPRYYRARHRLGQAHHRAPDAWVRLP